MSTTQTLSKIGGLLLLLGGCGLPQDCPTSLHTEWPPLALSVDNLPYDWGKVVSLVEEDFPGITVIFQDREAYLPEGWAQVNILEADGGDAVGLAYFHLGRADVFALSVQKYCFIGSYEQGIANTIAHEYGHLVGWSHVEDECSVMIDTFKYDSCLVNRSTANLPPPILQRRPHGTTTISEGEGVPKVSTVGIRD